MIAILLKLSQVFYTILLNLLKLNNFFNDSLLNIFNKILLNFQSLFSKWQKLLLKRQQKIFFLFILNLKIKIIDKLGFIKS